MREAVPAQPDLGTGSMIPASSSRTQRVVERAPGQLAQRLLVELGAERGRQLRDAEVDAGRPEAGREDFVDARRQHLPGLRGRGRCG